MHICSVWRIPTISVLISWVCTPACYAHYGSNNQCAKPLRLRLRILAQGWWEPLKMGTAHVKHLSTASKQQNPPNQPLQTPCPPFLTHRAVLSPFDPKIILPHHHKVHIYTALITLHPLPQNLAPFSYSAPNISPTPGILPQPLAPFLSILISLLTERRYCHSVPSIQRYFAIKFLNDVSYTHWLRVIWAE